MMKETPPELEVFRAPFEVAIFCDCFRTKIILMDDRGAQLQEAQFIGYFGQYATSAAHTHRAMSSASAVDIARTEASVAFQLKTALLQKTR